MICVRTPVCVCVCVCVLHVSRNFDPPSVNCAYEALFSQQPGERERKREKKVLMLGLFTRGITMKRVEKESDATVKL